MPDAEPPLRAIRLAGAATISEAASIRDRLAAAIEGATALAIDCSAVDEADASFAQLLLAAGRTAEAGGIRLTLRAGDAVSGLLRRAGLDSLPGLTPTDDPEPRP